MDPINPFEIESLSFKDGSPMDKKHALKTGNEPPVLSWKHVPKNTKTLVLIVDDPDAPTKDPWVHWVVYNIPDTETGLIKPLERTPELPNGTRQGMNTFNKIGYDGPHPPEGENHRYFFRLYALDEELPIPPGKSKDEVILAMENHIIGKAHLVGTFERT